MQPNLIDEEAIDLLNSITYLVGDVATVQNMPYICVKRPFDGETVEFLNSLSKRLMKSSDAKDYPDIITLGFWMRKSSVLALKERFIKNSGDIRVGRGVAFHITPSNVPVNYVYSLLAGLLTGNTNIVRIPSKDFPQISILNREITETLKKYPAMKPYICLVRYGREQKINDIFSAIADTRIIWGGDSTIAEIRRSTLSSRACDISFADRYSLAIINSDRYLELEDKVRLAEEFYNDTYLNDQNACTSPRVVIWLGSQKEAAKNEFWKYEHDLVLKKYRFQPIMGINKLTSAYILATAMKGIKIEKAQDNYVIRLKIPQLEAELMDFKDNSGFFFEYDCEDIMELRNFCNNTHCQTIGFLGDKDEILPLIMSGIKGVDRVVPIGKTMDFDFIWDGYNLVERLTRTIAVKI